MSYYRCGACGTSIEHTDMFCYECGTKVPDTRQITTSYESGISLHDIFSNPNSIRDKVRPYVFDSETKRIWGEGLIGNYHVSDCNHVDCYGICTDKEKTHNS